MIKRYDSEPSVSKGQFEYVEMVEFTDGRFVLYVDYLKDKEEARELIQLIRDDLWDRSNEGIVDVGNSVWIKINKYLSATNE